MPISVGESDTDRTRNVFGEMGYTDLYHQCHMSLFATSGPFYNNESPSYTIVNVLAQPENRTGKAGQSVVIFDSGRMVPTGSITQPPRISMLACAYMGQPAV